MRARDRRSRHSSEQFDQSEIEGFWMKRISLSVVVFLSFAIVVNAQTSQTLIMGFSPAGAQKQAQIEKQFKAIPRAGNIEKFHEWLTSEPHPAGSERNNQLAREIADRWREQGLEDVRVHQYDVLSSDPVSLSLEMISPVKYTATLREGAYDVDPATKDPKAQLGYISMSASGEITAPVVYAFSGNPHDYEVLKKNGIDVKGKIVLVRYSNPYSYRGFKALTAQKLGAAAILIYSDPMEDGYKKGKVFPDGPWGPESHIQRGAITYDFMVAGDPTTPGWASVPGAKHIDPKEAISMPNIIAMALSWKDAKPILENMGGPEAPKQWQGGLPIKYTLGGKATLHLNVRMDQRIKPNYVVEGRIKGSELPDEWVVFGNHRDAWVYGGVDPSSGTASLLEMTRAFGELAKKGVRPRRTLIFCSWDGEEVGLTGSTEWGEQFADDLQKKAVAYLNVDSSASGPDFSPSAVAQLAPMLVEITKTIDDPSGTTLYEAWKKSAAKGSAEATSATVNGDKPDLNKEKGTAAKKTATSISDDDLVDTRIGSGSDHTVFLNHLGIPTVGLDFNGPYGVYHSMYDDHYWMSHFGDPGFKYHTVVSQLWGVLGMRLANADVFPFDFSFLGKQLRSWVQEVEAKDGAKQNLDFGPLYASLKEFDRQAAMAKVTARDSSEGNTFGLKPSANPHKELNEGLRTFEQGWLSGQGIPNRPWFKHQLYAARYTYAHLELPGLTEAVEAKDWARAKEQLNLLKGLVDKQAATLRKLCTCEL
jgi:N-acetylated-alpha-linked acidic dipeptidase